MVVGTRRISGVESVLRGIVVPRFLASEVENSKPSRVTLSEMAFEERC